MGFKKRVVVTGVGIFCSLGGNKVEVLDAMKQGISGIREITAFSTEGLGSNLGAEIREYPFPPEIKDFPRGIQFAVIAGREALADAGLCGKEKENTSLGLSYATCNGDLTSFEKGGRLEEIDQKASFFLPRFQQGDYVAAELKIRGPVITNATACAASGSALVFAGDLVADGYADAVLAGGADSLSQTVQAGFSILKSLSVKPCAPFGELRGLTLGEGAAFILLESLDNALKRSAPKIYAEFLGYGLSQDAYHATAPHPEGEGVSRALKFALTDAGITPGEIEYINVHGTGTEANDSAEFTGIKAVFGNKQIANVMISSVKSSFGHTLGAAAVIEYVATLLAVEQGLLPATLHVESLREGCEEAGLIVGDMPEKTINYFMCNNSAFGGHNSSLVSKRWNEDFHNMGNNKNKKTEQKFSVNDKADRSSRVVIAGMGMANHYGCFAGTLPESFFLSGDDLPVFSNYRDKVKEYIKPFYTRRMNSLTQLCMAASCLALRDGGLPLGENGLKWEDENAEGTGLYFGTSYGSFYSLSRYLSPIFNQGLSFASALYFPDTVLNATPGKLATGLGGILGSGSTFCTGGNEGLICSFAAYTALKNSQQKFCLAGCGEESSPLETEINRVLGLDKSSYSLSEGASFILFTTLRQAEKEKMKVYGEVLSFGFSYSGMQINQHAAGYSQAVIQALERANSKADEIDFVFYNDTGLPEITGIEEDVLKSIFSSEKTLIRTFNNIFGYVPAVSSLYNLYAAADQLSRRDDWKRGMVVTSSYNRNNVAVIIGKAN